MAVGVARIVASCWGHKGKRRSGRQNGAWVEDGAVQRRRVKQITTEEPGQADGSSEGAPGPRALHRHTLAVPFLPSTAGLALRNPEEPRGGRHFIPQVKDRPGTCGCCDPRAHVLSTATAAWAVCRGARARGLCLHPHHPPRVC